MQTISQSPENFTARRLNRVRRVLVLSIDGQGAQDTSVAQRRIVGGVFAIFSLVSGAQIDRFNFETLTVVNQQVQEFVAAIKQSRCAEAKTIDGARCDDVAGALVHVSLAGLPDSPAKEQLLAIRTGLTLRKDDVDLLIDAGRSAILDSAALRDFLNGYAVRPSPNARSAGVQG
jgi:hypothetical protein